MRHCACFSLILILLTFVFSSCDSPSGSKPESITKPSLVSPTNNATNIPLTPTFQWSGAADILEVGSNPNFTGVKSSYNVSGQSFTVPSASPLSQHARYYWHAGKTSGNEVYWSDDIFTFETVQ